MAVQEMTRQAMNGSRALPLPSHTAATHLQRTEHLTAGVTSFRSQQVLTKLLPSHRRLIQKKRNSPHQEGA